MSVAVEHWEGLPPPHELFARFCDRPGSWLLESGLAVGALGQFSFLGSDPFLTLRAVEGGLSVNEDGRERRIRGDVVPALRTLLGKYGAAPHDRLPFSGGAVGYFSYELGARWENIPRRRPATRTMPELELGFFDGLLAYEHATGRWYAVANPVHRASAPEILERLRRVAFGGGRRSEAAWPRTVNCSACDTREHYTAAVRRVREYIAAGDVYQVNLAHAFVAEPVGDPYALYLRLRARSPAPFASYLSTSFGQAISCSPERFLRLREGLVETRPIKGTRPRGKNVAEDEALARELLASAKDRAELLMIVDLERNDLGRVCVPGSIAVERLYQVETHPTVFHLVAAVTGRLRSECDALDLLRASFPGGSITGAPKIRAMQIIDELETRRRDLYTGSIGYLGFDGSCDLNIAIRTLLCSEGQATYHVGAGIVWDSDPEAEYEETLAKGRALREALCGEGIGDGPQQLAGETDAASPS